MSNERPSDQLPALQSQAKSHAAALLPGYMNRFHLLTSGEVAKICRVSLRTVTKWIDRGTLKGYRLPCSKHRRVCEAELKRFLRDQDMPWDVPPTTPRSTKRSESSRPST